MKPNHIILGIAFICIVIASVLYFYAYSHDQYRALPQTSTSTPASSTSTSSAKVSTAAIADGTYTVRIHTIMTTGEDTSIAFSHVTYFDGSAASSSANQDVKCPNKPLAACVPTLTKGFYVRPSGVADFTAPLPTGTPIVLRDASHATVKTLRNMVRDFEPVFDVVIKNGNIVYLTEKSPA